MSVPLTARDRLISGVGAIVALCACVWLAWGEWGPDGRGHRPAGAPAPRDVLEGARKHAQAERWAQVVEALKGVAEDSTVGDEAASLRAQATMEQRHEQAFRALQRSLVDDRLAAAREALKRIPPGSVYRQRAERLVKRQE